MQDIHDSLLTGYEVDGKHQTIVLHTEPHQGGGSAFIDVLFTGIVAYHFEGDCLGNVLFDIHQVPASEMIGDGTAFTKRSRQYGWPAGWNPEKESIEEFFSRQGCHIYQVHCSYGMYGWIAAAAMQQKVRTT
jgi:hypothetical protein